VTDRRVLKLDGKLLYTLDRARVKSVSGHGLYIVVREQHVGLVLEALPDPEAALFALREKPVAV
jgi:hypothetical protein